ncbi:MAG: glycosyl transferase [Pseudomonadales bacterium]|nr:glycosyl transferase [Pseudomonadales bacterium]
MANSGKHWSNVGEAGSMLGMKLLLLSYRLFGRRVFKVILTPVMVYYYLMRKNERQASKQYLEKISPFLEKERQNSLSSFQHFMNFGDQLLDTFLVWKGMLGKDDVIFETQSIVGKMADSPGKKGGIIIISHLGNIEVCNALAQKFPNIRMTLLVYTEHSGQFNTIIDRKDGESHVNILQVSDMSPASAMILSDRIDKGEFIIISGDRTPVSGNDRISDVTFLGETASMPQGAFLVASILKCPVYLIFCLKQQKRYHVFVELFSESLEFKRKDRPVGIDKAVQKYADRLAYYCVKAPMQWFNFFPFWKTDTAKNSKECDSGSC